jgi:hypothetical protein
MRGRRERLMEADIEMEDGLFLAAFESGSLPEECFRHRDHVRAAWLLLQEAPPAAALARFTGALKRFAASLGKSRLYHETITWAYVLLINERMERSGRDASWEEFAESNADGGPRSSGLTTATTRSSQISLGRSSCCPTEFRVEASAAATEPGYDAMAGRQLSHGR